MKIHLRFILKGKLIFVFFVYVQIEYLSLYKQKPIDFIRFHLNMFRDHILINVYFSLDIKLFVYMSLRNKEDFFKLIVIINQF